MQHEAQYIARAFNQHIGNEINELIEQIQIDHRTRVFTRTILVTLAILVMVSLIIK